MTTKKCPSDEEVVAALRVLRAWLEPEPKPVATRPEWTSRANAKELFGKTFRAIDEWASRRGIHRYSIVRSPAYRTADLDAAVIATGRAPSVPPKDDAEEEYARLIAEMDAKPPRGRRK